MATPVSVGAALACRSLLDGRSDKLQLRPLEDDSSMFELPDPATLRSLNKEYKEKRMKAQTAELWLGIERLIRLYTSRDGNPYSRPGKRKRECPRLEIMIDYDHFTYPKETIQPIVDAINKKGVWRAYTNADEELHIVSRDEPEDESEAEEEAESKAEEDDKEEDEDYEDEDEPISETSEEEAESPVIAKPPQLTRQTSVAAAAAATAKPAPKEE